MIQNKNKLKSDPNYPENFWPKILTLLTIGAFIYWVMTSQNADSIIDQYLFDPIFRQFDRIRQISFTKMINRFLSSERTKWIFVIGIVAIGAGFTARNVISYPTECIKEEMVKDFVLPKSTDSNKFFS